MRNQILQFPEQFVKGVELAKSVKINKPYDKVIICGIGGSGIAGEILNFWQELAGVPKTFYIHRDYDLPAWTSKNNLVICISWSGNTEETISSLESALKLGVPIVSITTGGKLAELSFTNNSPAVLIPEKNLKPRMGIGYMTAVLFQLLGLEENIVWVSLDAQKTEIEGKQLAEKISTTPLLYSSYKWRVIPRLWKILFNENCKIHAFWNYLPGMAHNELAGFEKKPTDCGRQITADFFPIFFRNSDDDPRQNKNIDTTIAILNKREYNYNIVNISNGDKPLEAVLNSYILGLWTTYYLAQKIGVDPEKVELIEEYKKLKG